MASLGDFIDRGGRTYRFEGSPLAFRFWSPWGKNIYSNDTLANAKLDVPIDDTLDEKVIELETTIDSVRYLFVQKAAGYGASFDLSFDQIFRTDFGVTANSKTKTEADAFTFSNGELVFVSDIGEAGEGFLLTFDGTDLNSGVYWMQRASNTIATSPTVGDVFPHLDSNWKCIDATANKEVFVITQQKPVFIHTITENIAANETNGGIITNTGAAATVVLSMQAANEVEGAHCTIQKTTSQTFTINDSAAVEIGSSTQAAPRSLELSFVNGAWKLGFALGNW